MTSAPRSARFAFDGRFLLGVALVLGALVRFYTPVTGGFVAMDGGLFLLAAQEIGNHHFALPATLPYPTISPQLPFCYPPLGFYLLALLRLVGVPLEWSLRFVPPAFATATIWAVWNLARTIFQGDERRGLIAGLSALFFALTTGGFLWLVMGGGISRAPGLFLALWGLERGFSLLRDGNKKAFWPLTFLLALTVLTHLERARFLIIALLLVWLLLNRKWRGLALVGASLAGALLLSSPWWATCLARFGFGPFLASYASASAGSWMAGYSGQVGVGFGGESFPVLICLALAGFWVFRRRAPFVGAWYVAIWALELRSGVGFISIPIAIGAAAFVACVPRVLSWTLGAAVFLWLLFDASGAPAKLRVLSPATRSAMAWCKQNTPLDARFVVVPPGVIPIWATDIDGEWFPVLARRTAPLTVQGSEWLPTGTFAAQQKRHALVFRQTSWAQVQADMQLQQVRADWIFWPRSKRTGSKRRKIQNEILADKRWRVAFQNEDVLVFARRNALVKALSSSP